MRHQAIAIIWTLVFASGCAGNLRQRAYDGARTAKGIVDAGEKFYTDSGRRRIAECRAKNLPDATAREKCLGPYAPDTAEKIKTAFNVVHGAQLALYLLLIDQTADKAEMQRALVDLLSKIGALRQLLEDAKLVGGGN